MYYNMIKGGQFCGCLYGQGGIVMYTIMVWGGIVMYTIMVLGRIVIYTIMVWVG